MSYYISCGKGWQHLYTPLIEQCEREGIEILQVKEKFGGLRFYVSVVPDGSTIYENIDAAEIESLATCEVCGEPGELSGGDGRWVRTLCDKHKGHSWRG